jgi:hypothetical protein
MKNLFLTLFALVSVNLFSQCENDSINPYFVNFEPEVTISCDVDLSVVFPVALDNCDDSVEIAWYEDLSLFALNGISQQKSSKIELSELVSLYLKSKKSPAVEALIGQNLVAEGMGVRGRLQFGEVTAVLLPSVDQVLGNWVRS